MPPMTLPLQQLKKRRSDSDLASAVFGSFSGLLKALSPSKQTRIYSTRILLLLVWLSALIQPILADAPDFVRDVRPILQQHCYKCHGEEKQKSSLRLDIKSEALKGGDLYGPSILAEDTTKSPILLLIKESDPASRMPPESAPLSSSEIQTIERWLAAGGIWPDGVDLAKLEDRRSHWSLQKVQRPTLPQISNPSWPQTGLDYFVLDRLEQAGLSPSRETQRRVWLRRVTLDLIGLPPSPNEMESFLRDQSPDAYERVVDRLLQSQSYGERWAQHWLDVVRYADTHGFEVNTERPNAWPYRDYVIAAFNQDTSYDRFICEQIIGDQLQQDPATGFLITASVLLPGQIGQDEPSKRLARQDSLDEIVINIGQTFLGLSVGCARCHDHKFDAISQKDYYAMQALIAGVEYEERELLTEEAKKAREKTQQAKGAIEQLDRQLSRIGLLANAGNKRPPVHPRYNTDRIAPRSTSKLRFTILSTNNLEPCIDELEIYNSAGVNVALASQGAKIQSSGDRVDPNRHELRFVNDGVYGNTRSWMSSEMGKGWLEVEFTKPEQIDCIVWGRDREEVYRDRLALEYKIEVTDEQGQWQVVADSTDRATFVPDAKIPDIASIEGLPPEDIDSAKKISEQRRVLQAEITQVAAGQFAFAGKFRKPDQIKLLSRGDPEQPKDIVEPGMLSAIADIKLSVESDDAERRSRLANWIANGDNPLTARVMANRIWQYHFGVGLVESANDFGRNGSKPTHPELLDWLASELIAKEWSLKSMHRMIVLSATYRQDSAWNEQAFREDADSRLLWRYPPRRMDAEMMRDSMLSISGELYRSMGGPGFDLFDKRGGLSGFNPVENFPPNGLRRMVYAHKVRRERDAVFGVFDCPDAGQSTARRRESTTPLQALNLLNSRFTIDRAAFLANRIKAGSAQDSKAQIDSAFQLVLGRSPTTEEMEELQHLTAESGLESLCRALFNSNEFLLIP